MSKQPKPIPSRVKTQYTVEVRPMVTAMTGQPDSKGPLPKQPKPAKRKPTDAEKIVAKFFDWMPEEAVDHSLVKHIERAIRAAVKETWSACEKHESENSESHKAQIKGQIEQRFGVKL